MPNETDPVKDKPKTEKFVLRLPSGMRNKIALIARQNRRSMNSQIVCHLERLIEQETLLSKEQGIAETEGEYSTSEKPHNGKQLVSLIEHLKDNEKNAFMSLMEAVLEKRAS